MRQSVIQSELEDDSPVTRERCEASKRVDLNRFAAIGGKPWYIVRAMTRAEVIEECLRVEERYGINAKPRCPECGDPYDGEECPHCEASDEAACGTRREKRQ